MEGYGMRQLTGPRLSVGDIMTRSGRKTMDTNLDMLIRDDILTPDILEELVLDLHEFPDLSLHLSHHRFFKELVFAICRIMDYHTPKMAR